MKMQSEPIIETGQFDSSSFRGSFSSQSLTSDEKYCSSFFSLNAGQKYSFSDNWQHDLFVLSGEATLEDKKYFKGSYLSRKGAFTLRASEDSVLCLFYYSEPLNTNSRNISMVPEDRVWQLGMVNGLSICRLRTFGHSVSLVSWEKGTKIPAHKHQFGEEILVLSGKLCDSRGALSVNEWIRLYPSAEHAPFVQEKTEIFLRSGHLL